MDIGNWKSTVGHRTMDIGHWKWVACPITQSSLAAPLEIALFVDYQLGATALNFHTALEITPLVIHPRSESTGKQAVGRTHRQDQTCDCLSHRHKLGSTCDEIRSHKNIPNASPTLTTLYGLDADVVGRRSSTRLNGVADREDDNSDNEEARHH